MEKSPDAFRTITEVSKWLDTPAHVLRFWESRFPEVSPVKRAGGRRYYRPEDMRILGGIKTMLHDRGQTIRDVQDLLATNGPQGVAALSPGLDFSAPAADSPATPRFNLHTHSPTPDDLPADRAPRPEGESNTVQDRSMGRPSHGDMAGEIGTDAPGASPWGRPAPGRPDAPEKIRGFMVNDLSLSSETPAPSGAATATSGRASYAAQTPETSAESPDNADSKTPTRLSASSPPPMSLQSPPVSAPETDIEAENRVDHQDAAPPVTETQDDAIDTEVADAEMVVVRPPRRPALPKDPVDPRSATRPGIAAELRALNATEQHARKAILSPCGARLMTLRHRFEGN